MEEEEEGEEGREGGKEEAKEGGKEDGLIVGVVELESGGCSRTSQ
jgi:hypothetical protein